MNFIIIKLCNVICNTIKGYVVVENENKVLNIPANPSKFQFMNTVDSKVIMTLRGVTIEQDNYAKLLGVNIDKNLILKSM